MYATTSFEHFDRTVAKGDELPDDDPLVVACPDLFAPQPPTPPKAKAPAKVKKEK